MTLVHRLQFTPLFAKRCLTLFLSHTFMLFSYQGSRPDVLIVFIDIMMIWIFLFLLMAFIFQMIMPSHTQGANSTRTKHLERPEREDGDEEENNTKLIDAMLRVSEDKPGYRHRDDTKLLCFGIQGEVVHCST